MAPCESCRLRWREGRPGGQASGCVTRPAGVWTSCRVGVQCGAVSGQQTQQIEALHRRQMRSQGCKSGGVVRELIVAKVTGVPRVSEVTVQLPRKQGPHSLTRGAPRVGLAAVSPPALCLHFRVVMQWLPGFCFSHVAVAHQSMRPSGTFHLRFCKKVILHEGAGGTTVSEPHSPGSSSALPPGECVTFPGPVSAPPVLGC